MLSSLVPSWVRLLWREPILRRIWLGALLSALGDRLTNLALIWYVVERSRDGAQVGTLLLCIALPSALTGGPIGRLLDRRQPRPLMVGDNVLRAVLIALVPLLDRSGRLSFPLLCALGAVSGALAPATRIGTSLVIRRLTDDHERGDANAALAFTEQAATIAGPAVAGLIVASWGATSALWIDGLSFLAMAWALLAVPTLARDASAPQPRATAAVHELLRPAVLAVTALSGLFFFTYGPTEAALPLFVRDTLRSDARGMGTLWSAVGIGATAGSLATGWLARRGHTGVVLAAIMVLWGGFEWLLSSAGALAPAALAFLAGGVVWGPYLALKTTLMQRLIPEERLGATLGLQSALLTPTAPLGTALGGALLRIAAPHTLLAGSGIACIVGGLIALAVPALRQRDGDTRLD